MNSNSSAQLCRLCLETGSDLVNVFEQFEDSTIASVLATHFWFQISKDDGMPEWVCETCWTHTKTFHHFYRKLELRHQNHSDSIVLVKVDEIKRERSVSPTELTLEYDFVVHKYEVEEETEEISEATENLQTLSKETSCDEDDRDKSCDPSEAEETTDDEDQPSLDKRIKRPRRRPERIKEDEEISKFFKMTCDICSYVEFDTMNSMRKHYRQVHKKNGYLVCCGNKFGRRFMMLDHIRYHGNPTAHHCDKCGKNFKGRDALEKHIKNHARVPRAHKCSLCPKAYSSAITLNYHVRDRHSTDTIVRFSCDICGKSYSTKYVLTSHMKNSHEPTLGQGHVCDVCGRNFTTKVDMEYHMEMKHSTTPPPRVQCDICGVWSKSKRCLQQHLRKHKLKQNAEYSKVVDCPICKKKVQNNRLANHIQNSHGERKHQCKYCDKAFRTSKNLKEHTALHTGEDLYSCTYCDRTFKSNANMYKHRKTAHTAEWTRDKAEKNSDIIQ